MKTKRLIAIAFVIAALTPSAGTLTICGHPFVFGHTYICSPPW
jgi:hypothetical protein